MCGIAAIFSTGTPVSIGLARRMADAVRHRGPDGEGYVAIARDATGASAFGGPDTAAGCFVTGHPYLPAARVENSNATAEVLFAHRRLAIIDLSAAGHQPMSYAGGRYWLVYNGEVYNHLELRTDLESLGHVFASHSDTEVILAAYAQWGATCLSRFNGMFAFVLFDRKARRVFMARDRFGVKPLYYWISPAGELAVASEIKQFTVLPGWEARLNRRRTYDFLAWGLSEQSDETLFNGVRQLRGGESVEFGLDDLERHAASGTLPVVGWYALRPEPYSGGYDRACEHFLQLLTDAVRLRQRSDVPVGSCLSGGLDSSAIVCLVHRLLSRTSGNAGQSTFTAYAETGRLDERPYAREVIRQTGAQAFFVCPDNSELFEQLSEIAWHMDEPFSSTSMFAQWKVFEAADRHGVKVMLDGQGADELLGGYPVFWGSRLAGLLHARRFVELAREVGALNRARPGSGTAALLQMAPALLPARWVACLRTIAGTDPATPAWLSLQALGVEPQNPFSASAGNYRRSVARLTTAQIERVNLPMLLHWEDRNSMAHSVEARVPFLDYRLVEFALGLPDEFKLKDAWTKRILRDSMAGILPNSIRERRDKIGFETPEHAWMTTSPEPFRRALENAVASSQGIIAAAPARLLLEEIIAKRAPYSYIPWRLISFGAWVERFSVDCVTR